MPGAASLTGGTFTASYTYGDDGTFPVTVTVTDDDGDSGTTRAALRSTTSTLPPRSRAGSDQWNGQQVISRSPAARSTSRANGTDAGSDDLAFPGTSGTAPR